MPFISFWSRELLRNFSKFSMYFHPFTKYLRTKTYYKLEALVNPAQFIHCFLTVGFYNAISDSFHNYIIWITLRGTDFTSGPESLRSHEEVRISAFIKGRKEVKDVKSKQTTQFLALIQFNMCLEYWFTIQNGRRKNNKKENTLNVNIT